MCSYTASQCHAAIWAGGAKARPDFVTRTNANAAQPLPYISRLGESRFCCCLNSEKLGLGFRRQYPRFPQMTRLYYDATLV